MTKVIAACLLLAAQTYNIPPAVMIGILSVEGGTIGQSVNNTNGTSDLGLMQINTLWVPQLAGHWGVSEHTAKTWIQNDACTNLGVSAWILRKHISETQSLSRSIAYYHSRTPSLGNRYRKKVYNAMKEQGLINVGQ